MFFKRADINSAVEECRNTPGAVLLDVRGADEYAAGHIAGSVNVPLPAIQTARERIAELDTPLFVYCLSGGRSRSAVSALKAMGYTNVTDLGGIRGWRGAVER